MNRILQTIVLFSAVLLSYSCVNKIADVPEMDEIELSVSLDSAQQIDWNRFTLSGKVTLKKGTAKKVQYAIEYWEDGKEHGLAPETTYHCRVRVDLFTSNEITIKTGMIPVNSFSLN